MTYNLSDIERTLLSAYMDGELPAAEAVRAEALLASSEEARGYLQELRAVDSLTGQAFEVTAATAAAGVPLAGALSNKLTGSAIEAAAERAVLAKAVTSGSWGLAGVVGAAAAVAVGAALMLQTPKQLFDTQSPKQPVATAGSQHNRTIAAPVADLDTSNLIVPQMTTSDLLAFAVHGTLPIDEKRSRFITLASKGSDSLVCKVHTTAPEEIDRSVAAIDLGEMQMLDSIQRVIRTSLIHSNNGIALRSDITSLRLGVIRTFEQCVPRMPVQMRESLDRTRVELATMGRVFGEPERSGAIILDGNTQVIYRMLPAGELFGGEEPEMFSQPTEVVFDFDSEPFFAVDPHALRAFETRVRVQSPDLPMAAASVPVEPSHMESNPVGVRPSRRRATFVAEAPAASLPSENTDLELPKEEVQFRRRTTAREVYGLTLKVRRNDSLLNAADDAIREAEERLKKVDSLMNRLQKKLRKKIGEQNRSGDEKPEGTQSQGGGGADGDE